MRFLVVFLLAFSIRAAVVQGVVLDEETGNPLARTLVTLTPLPGTPAGTIALRAGDRGSFTILSVRAGWYILKTSRRGFADTEAGALRPGRAGLPFEITPDTQSTFIQIRMRRLAAATGTVVDENSVGIPDWPVHIYTSKKPIRRIAESKTDDRGHFRIGFLDPGKYVVRSGPGVLEDNSQLLPTYYKYGTELESSEAFRLRLGETQTDLIIRPVKGRLLEISGTLGQPYIDQTPVNLTLITDTGRRVIATSPGLFSAAGIPPGPIELVVEGVQCGSYTRMLLDKDQSNIRVGCPKVEPLSIDWRSQGFKPTQGYPLIMRRADLDGTGPPKVFKSRDILVPGHWEFTTDLSPDYYITSVRAQFGTESSPRNDGWFGVYLSNQPRMMVTVSTKPANISGAVATGGKPVAGAAVYIEWFNPDVSDKRLQLWSLRTDAQGNFSLPGLTPGRYRAISSFDFDPDDVFIMERASEMTLKEGDTVTKALELQLP